MVGPLSSRKSFEFQGWVYLEDWGKLLTWDAADMDHPDPVSPDYYISGENTYGELPNSHYNGNFYGPPGWHNVRYGQETPNE